MVRGMTRLPQRRSPRLAAFDYSTPGAYFVTICTWRKRCLFGQVLDGRMALSEAGQIAEHEWLRTAETRQYVDLDVHIVMPNHVHGLIIIREHPLASATCSSSLRHSLSAIVGGFKAATSRRIAIVAPSHCSAVWQRSYYERVIRDGGELSAVREYLANNPARWGA
jgi:REP-associated tyrosine transposase